MAIKNGLALLAAVVMTSYIVVAAAQGTPEQVIMFDNKGKSVEELGPPQATGISD